MKQSFLPNQIGLILQNLQIGEVVAIPTETVYGLAGDISNIDAIHKIFELKKRPIHHPLIIHIASISDLSTYAIDIPQYVFELAHHFWPGPLTFVLKKSHQVGEWVTGGQQTVGIRMPAHPLTLSLIEQLGSPLAAPSANRFGCISPTTAEHVLHEFQNKIKVLDGGPCSVGIESTIIDATHPEYAVILRPGIISKQMLENKLKDIEIRQNESSTVQVSGTLKHHYAPSKLCLLFEGLDDLEHISQTVCDSIYALVLNDYLTQEKRIFAKMPNDPIAYARVLYHELRKADQSEAKIIMIEKPKQTTAWLAVYDRLIRSSAKSQESIEIK